MEASRIILDMKYARIIEILAQQLHLTREEAMDIFYNSPAFELIDKGVAEGHSFMLSNSDCKGKNEADNFFDVLYADYYIDRVMASRNVNANGAKRGKISELLVHSYRNTKDWQLNDINNHKSQRVAIKQKAYA